MATHGSRLSQCKDYTHVCAGITPVTPLEALRMSSISYFLNSLQQSYVASHQHRLDSLIMILIMKVSRLYTKIVALLSPDTHGRKSETSFYRQARVQALN